jgi:DNA-binding Lrp family transcriptional regulator
MWQPAFRNLLNGSLAEIQSRNPKYSMRNLARRIKVGSGPLSLYLAGKRSPREAEARRILSRLPVSPQARENFLHLLEGPPERALVPEDDLFLHWTTLAVRNLLLVKGQAGDVASIAKRLGIEEAEVKRAVSYLLRKKLIRRQGARYVYAAGEVSSRDEIPSKTLERAQKRYALHSFRKYSLPPGERDFTSMTFVGDRAAMKAAKAEIRGFYRKLEALMNGPQAGEVYRLSIQLCPLTVPGDS